VVGDPLGVGARGAAEDLFCLAGEGRRLPDLLAYLAIKDSADGSEKLC
jgi:hypothetical protein